MMGTRSMAPLEPAIAVLMTASIALAGGAAGPGPPRTEAEQKEAVLIDFQESTERLRAHLEALTVTIGERSISTPENLRKAQEYIEAAYRESGLHVTTEPYRFQHFEVANVVAQIDFCERPSKRYLLGAHYDSVVGTVGADDNASAVAVQLETARHLEAIRGRKELDLSVKLVSFALEENPAFDSPYMGSKVHAKGMKNRGEKLDGMICLEMVGYTCRQPGCQSYPFPLRFMGYPKTGDFIGIVGNTQSRGLTGSLLEAFRRNLDLPAIPLTVPLNGRVLPSVRLSDHSAFWDEGFKAVMVTDSAFFRNPHYHLTSDTMDTLDYPFMAELVESLITFFCAGEQK
jgi:hypothetical protein